MSDYFVVWKYISLFYYTMKIFQAISKITLSLLLQKKEKLHTLQEISNQVETKNRHKSTKNIYICL